MFNSPLCLDAVPQLLGLFDLSVAPTLLFYAYIPIIAISLFLSITVAIKDQFSLKGKLLLAISLSFSIWVLNMIFQWTAVHAGIMHFSWQITALIEILIPISTIYFVYVFLNNGKDVSDRVKFIFAFLILLTAMLLPTSWNMSGFDVSYCQSTVGPLLHYIYYFEIFVAIWILGLGLKEYLNLKNNQKIKTKDDYLKQTTIITIISAIFLVIFSLSNLVGELTQIYEINLIGPIGMVLFIAMLSYLIVKFKAFNIKIIGTKVLMYALIILISSQFFFIRVTTNFILTGITLVAIVILGGYLIKSVEKEVAQREEIERLAASLSKANDKLWVANEKLKELDRQKTEFVSIASHQLRSPLTAIKGYSSMLLEGSFGPLEEKAREAVDRIFQSSQKLVTVIEDFLNITRIELGRMKYEIKVFDLGQLAQMVIKDQEPNIKRSGLAISFKDGTGDHQISADEGKVSQVISNIIDNAIKYTPASPSQGGPTGWVKIKVENLPVKRSKGKETVRISVSDSGVGIKPETLPKLFEKFVRADADKVNITGTGLGLYVAKQIIEGLGGKIWAESEGQGKGSSFFVEFPKATS